MTMCTIPPLDEEAWENLMNVLRHGSTEGRED